MIEKAKQGLAAVSQLPLMLNAHMYAVLAVFFAAMALMIEVFTTVEYGEAEWIFITLIVRELLAAFARTVKWYTRGAEDD